LLLYVTLVVVVGPMNFFGLTEDDSIYLSSAQAIANGHGYVLASVPGTPPATKYPPLFPFVLSLIWRWSPTFPQNLSLAMSVNIASGLLFLIAAFVLLKTFRVLRDWEAIAIVALCGVHPAVIVHSANILAEMPFAAATLGTILLTHFGAKAEGKGWHTLLAGLLASLSGLLRTLGLPIALAMGFFLVFRRGWRSLAWYAVGLVPLAVVTIASKIGQPHVPLGTGSACEDVWRMNWLYYTDYIGFWKSDVLASLTFWAVLKQNLVALLLQPGSYLVDPRFVRPDLIAAAPALILSAAAFSGLFVRMESPHRSPVHTALFCYAIPLMLWNYTIMERFLIPFLPFFIAGAWVELRHLIQRIKLSAQTHSERPATVVLSSAIALATLGIAWSLTVGTLVIHGESRARRQIRDEKLQAYSWLTLHTDPSETVIAYEDASLYLYSGRKAMRPVIFAPSGALRPWRLDSELSCMDETGRRLGASLWLMSDDDFDAEWASATIAGRRREAQYEQQLTRIFASDQGHVRIYRLPKATATTQPDQLNGRPQTVPNHPSPE